MSSYLLKVIVIFVIAAVGAGIQLGAAWPVKLKANPDQPPDRTLIIPGPSGDTAADGPESTGMSNEADAPTTEDVQAGGTITLNDLEIDLATTKALYENQLATFVDARPADEFEAGHIESALHISPAMLEADSSLFVLDVIDPDKPIVIYCGGGDCDDSHRVAELLQDLRGLTQTHVFVDGYPAWADAGLPTNTGPDPWAE